MANCQNESHFVFLNIFSELAVTGNEVSTEVTCNGNRPTFLSLSVHFFCYIKLEIFLIR